MPASVVSSTDSQRALEHRTLHDRGVQHVRQAHVDGVDRLARDLVGDVEPPLRRADQLPVLRILQAGPAPAAASAAAAAATRPNVTVRPLGRWVMTLFAARALGGRHVPARGGGGDQHLARGGAGLAQVVLRRADGAAGAGRHVAPDAVAPAVLVRRGELGLHLAPVAFELFGDQHRQRGEAALAHLRLGDADDHGVVGLDHDPGGDFRRALGCACRPRSRTGCRSRARARRRRRRRWRGTRGGSRCGTRLMGTSSHSRVGWRRHGSPRGCADRCRNGRCW